MGDLNTTPRSWVSGEIPDAPTFNAEVRDPFTKLQDPWVDYAAAWTAATTNPSIGNGTIIAKYHRVGKTVSFIVKVTMGSTTNKGTGQWRIALPFTAAMTGWRISADLVSGGATYAGSAKASSTYLGLTCSALTAGNPERSVSPTTPGTWTTGDSFTVTGTYETT